MLFPSNRNCCCDVLPACVDLAGRPIAYVDKNVDTGAPGYLGDGSTPSNAYTSIQTAETTDGLTHQLHIKGYGAGDPYFETPTEFHTNACPVWIADDTTADLWLDGNIIGVGASHSGGYFRDIRTTSGIAGFRSLQQSTLLRCISDIDPVGGYGFFQLENCSLQDCVAKMAGNMFGSGSFGYFSSTSCTYSSCESLGVPAGFYSLSGSVLSGCYADLTMTGVPSVLNGFRLITGSLNSCLAENSARHGFLDCHDVTGCDAQNNGRCGYSNCTIIGTGNTASGNGGSCAGITYCDGATNPCGLCDECVAPFP